ncbi:MAG: response regulator [Lachnospiraceae bacterium]|nr:response regulator [Lachnospiraceae bacterium]
MNTHFLLQAVQVVTVAVLFSEVLVVFGKWKNAIHSYLFLACISSLVSNMGYLFELHAKSEEAYLFALKLSYLGRVWIVFAFFLFAARMCGIRIPGPLLSVLVLTHIGIYLAVLTIGRNSLYYTDYRFLMDEQFLRFYHGNGSVHDLFMALNTVLSVLAFGWILRAFRREKSLKGRQRLFMVLLAFGVQIFFFLLQITGVIGISKYYDLTMPGSLIGTVFMLIGILGFDLLGTREIAKDFAIDRISEGIIAVDNDGRIQYYNEPAARIYPQFDRFYTLPGCRKAGTGRVRGAGDPSREGLPQEALPQKNLTPYDILDRIRDAVREGETITVEDHIYTPEENDLLYQGESYGRLYALVDDTEHYRYMEELKKQKEIADSANASKSRFLASMSHEIRTPINAVLGMDEMILRESGEKNIRTYAADIMAAGRTLLSLINDILDLSKVEEGKMEIIPVQYDLSSLIGDLGNMIRDRAEKKGLKLTVRADSHIPHLLVGDEIRIRQCVMNLLTNAVKYTREGKVTFAVSFEKAGPDYILLGFTVTDTGIGMKAEDMENLFSPYKRIEEKRNRTIEGTGLGMSITRQLLDLMGTELKVKSEYGKGSEFSFFVKQEVADWEELGDYADRFDRVSAHSYEYRELFHAPDARILVVDDTEMNLTVMESLLKKTRIRIDTALSGKDAVRLAAGQPYDVIFIDHMMPDMDGIETLRKIRESGLSKDAPAVALTANAVSGARQHYLEAGFTDYLSKPVDGAKLEKLLLDRLPAEKILQAEEEPEAGEPSGGEIASAETPPSDLSERMAGVPEIDLQAGLANCGSEEGYRSVLTVFYQTAAGKADEIQEALREGDIPMYTVKVHALKSSARIIGAGELSGLARDLEDAGKREDTAYLGEHTDRLLTQYRALKEKLSFLEQQKESLPEISPEEMKDAYQTIAEVAQTMDFGMMENLLKDLKGFDLTPGDRERIARIESLLTQLDWEKMKQIAEKGLEQ